MPSTASIAAARRAACTDTVEWSITSAPRLSTWASAATFSSTSASSDTHSTTTSQSAKLSAERAARTPSSDASASALACVRLPTTASSAAGVQVAGHRRAHGAQPDESGTREGGRVDRLGHGPGPAMRGRAARGYPREQRAHRGGSAPQHAGRPRQCRAGRERAGRCRRGDQSVATSSSGVSSR